MLCNENGLQSGSDYYFFTVSSAAEQLLFYITSCGDFCADFGYHVARDNYHNYMCFYVLEGKLSVTCDGATRTVEKGMTGFINCHLPHEYHAIGYTKFLWLHFDGSNTAQFYQSITEQNGGFLSPSANGERVRQILQRVLDTCRSRQELPEAEASRILYDLLMTLRSGPQSAIPEEELSVVTHAVNYIKTHYHEPISLQDIAGEVNMSVYHFSRIFKKEVGFAPHEYLVRERIDAAKYLLKTTALPIKHIACAVGYKNESGFIFAFTEKVGISPGKFRTYPI